MSIFIGQNKTSKSPSTALQTQAPSPATNAPAQTDPTPAGTTLIPALTASLREGETLTLKVTRTPDGVTLLAIPPAPDAEDECHAKAAELRTLLVQPLYAKGAPQQAEAELIAMLQGQEDRPQLVARYVSLKEALVLADKAEAEAKKAEQNAKQRSKSARSKKPAAKKDADSKAESDLKEAANPTEKDTQTLDMFSDGNSEGESK